MIRRLALAIVLIALAGFVVPDFATAFWGALLYSLLTWLVNLALDDPHAQRVHIRRY